MNPHEQTKFDTKFEQFKRLLTLQGYSKVTIDNYRRSLKRLASWHGQCPDQRLTKADFEAYFTERLKTHSWSTIKCDRNAFMRYWELVLEREWSAIQLVKPPKTRRLPDILAADEINRTLACVKRTRYAVFLYTVYTLGIRLAEGLYLQIGDIDGSHMRVHIRQGKGCKDRYVILPEKTYHLLRAFWATHRHPKWLFPSKHANCSGPMDRGSVQKAMYQAIRDVHIHKQVSIHGLRHSYACHCIEQGMDLCSLQHLLGHEDPKTTTLYTQLTQIVQRNNADIVNGFVNQIQTPCIDLPSEQGGRDDNA